MEELSQLMASRLTNIEVSQCAFQTLEIIKTEGLSLGGDPATIKMVDQLQTAQELFAKSLKKVRTSTSTSKIAEADNYRDQDLQALFDSIKSYKSSRKQADRDAYSLLTIVFKEYKDAKRANYDIETALITKLLKELEKPEQAEAIETLAITRFVTDLKESQAAFEEVYNKRTSNELNQFSYNSKALRQDVLKIYQFLCDHLNMMCQVMEDETAEKLLHAVNKIRKDYVEMINKRHKKTKTVTE